MTSELLISCSIATTDSSSALGVEILLDDQVLLDVDHVENIINFHHTISDDDGEHSLKFVLKNKTSEHTKVDAEGNIIKDACLIIENVEFDGIALKQLLIDHSVYTHDFNGTKPETSNKFFGTMGCNGTVTLNFTTPIYLWLLENM
jgi:hypothetical protein